MLNTVLIVLLLLVAGIVLYLATLSGHYEVRRTRWVEADIAAVFAKIRDFKSWPDWSPWLMHEPEATLEFSADCGDEAGFYRWDGKRLGAGKLSHVKFNPPYGIKQRIEFTRPFKSVCRVAFELAEKDGGTEVTWSMQGTLPFLLRFMTRKTADMIGKDYDLGLAMLAGQLNPEAEHPVLRFDGETTLDPMRSLCKGFEGGLEAMKSAMKQDFPGLMAHIERNGGQTRGRPFTAYHTVNPKALYFVCDMAIPIEPTIEAGNFQVKALGGGRFYKVSLTGGYQFLELAWYSALTHVRMLKLKYDRSRPSLEVYVNDPEQTATSNAIQTELYVPIKG